jgi:hypothetical protein
MERNKINTAVVNKKQLMKKIHVSGQQLIIQMYYNYITLHAHTKEKEWVNRLKVYHQKYMPVVNKNSR